MIASSELAPAQEAAPPRGPWIVNARYDQLFTLAAWVLPFALWAVSSLGVAGLTAAALTFLVIDTSHQLASLPITLFDREVLRANRTFYLVGLAGLLAIACGVAFAKGVAEQVWVSLFLYWGIYHLIRQHIGFLRLYQVHAGMRDKSENRAQHLCLYSGTAAAYLFSMSRYLDMLDRSWIFHFNPPDALWRAVTVTFAVAVAMVARDCLRRRRRGERVCWLPLGYIALAVSNFFIGLVIAGRHDLIVGVLFVSSFHDFQYYAIVWSMARRRHRVEPRAAGALSFMFRGRTAWPFVLFIAVGGALMVVVQQRWTPLAAALGGVSSHLPTYFFAVFGASQYVHFYLDQRAWRLRSDARLRRDLLSLTP